MRQPRLKAPETWETAYYHCVSRVVDRRLAFDDEDKLQFVKLMRFYERVCQVRVITYCILSNHFHILVEVPAPPKVRPSEAELMEHIRKCYGKDRAHFEAEDIRQWRARGAAQVAEALVDGWFRRMWDVSSFMKTLKQRFTQWHNKRYGRKGTLWEDRYHSTIVEGGGRNHALAMVGAYIDLNPVRAAIIDDPKDYLWSGYGAALAGDKQALAGIERMVEHLNKSPKGARALEQYRMGLYTTGDAGDAYTPRQDKDKGEGLKTRRGFTREKAQAVRNEEGRLTRWEMLRQRVRYFTAGAVIGSRAFVDEVFETRRERFGPKREDGARPMKGADFGGLCTLRDLKTQVFS